MYQNAIDRTKPQKLYSQLLEILIGHIVKDEWKVGSQIPTEDQLCDGYNVSKATVRLAVAELVSLGYLKKIQGRGTFVRRKKPVNRIPMLLSLGEDDCTSCIVRVIESKTLLPDDEVRDHLNLRGGNYCFFVSRVIFVESTPRLLQKVHISSVLMSTPPNALINEDMHNRLSLHAFLEAGCGTRIQRVREVTDITRVSEPESGFLEISPDSPVLRVRHVCYAHGDEPMSYSETIYRTDGYARTVELERLRI